MLSKRILILVFVVAFLTLLTGCFPPTYRITPNLASNTVFLGKEAGISEFQLVMTYSDGNIDVTSDCNYDSDNVAVATAVEGFIQAVADGTSTIHITYWNGTYECSFDVIVIVAGFY